MTNCAKCFHAKENHKPVEGTAGKYHICTGSLTCTCEHFEEPYLVEFAQRIEEEKYIRKAIKSRCEYILEEIPQTRNAGEKTFAKIYKEIWYGVKIRKSVENSTTVNKFLHDEMPHDDTINREKRRCKQFKESLRTYDPKVLIQQTAIYQALVEMAAEA